MNQEQIGSFILSERKKQQLSQKALAEKAGLSRYQQILEIEKAQFGYSTEVLIKVVNALGFKLVFVDSNWEEQVEAEIKAETNEPVVQESGLFDFRKVEAAKEEDDPDRPKKKVTPKTKVKIQPNSPFKRSRVANKTK